MEPCYKRPTKEDFCCAFNNKHSRNISFKYKKKTTKRPTNISLEISTASQNSSASQIILRKKKFCLHFLHLSSVQGFSYTSCALGVPANSAWALWSLQWHTPIWHSRSQTAPSVPVLCRALSFQQPEAFYPSLKVSTLFEEAKSCMQESLHTHLYKWA